MPSKQPRSTLVRIDTEHLPSLIVDAGGQARNRFIEFFTARVRNPNTRAAYLSAVQQFSEWCEERELGLEDLQPMVVAAYVEELTAERSVATVRQHLSAIRMMFDYLVTGAPIGESSAIR